MSKSYGRVEIEETDNGWIVKSSYFTHAGEKIQVFMKWKDVVDFITGAMGQQQ